MIRDLRTPTLVISGSWNPSIFQPEWIASNILGIPKGEKINVAQCVIPNDDGNHKLINFFGNIGISSLGHRLEIFVNSGDNQTSDKSEEIAIKVLKALPHTPLQALGINFLFVEADPSGDLLDKLKTHEGLEKKHRIKQYNLTSTMVVDEDTDFNFYRTVNDSGLRFSLNFHTLVETESFKCLTGAIKKRLDFSVEFLRENYGVEVEGTEAFHLPLLQPLTGEET